MAVNDIVDLLRMLRREDGAELEAAAGAEAITLVEEMAGLIRERLRQSDMYYSLWDGFVQDPDNNRAELIGAIEAAVEGDVEFAVRLQNLEQVYDELALGDGGAMVETDDAGVLLAGHFEGETALIGESGSPITAGQFEREQGGDVIASQGDSDGETMVGMGADASPLTDAEEIGGSTYVYGRFQTDEDLEDSSDRPGSLYDSEVESASGAAPITTGDIRSLIQPVEMALSGNPQIGARDRRHLEERLSWIEQELGRGQALDMERLRTDLLYVRDAAPDLWEMLEWNLRDAGEMLPVSAQSILTEIAGPRGAEQSRFDIRE